MRCHGYSEYKQVFDEQDGSNTLYIEQNWCIHIHMAYDMHIITCIIFACILCEFFGIKSKKKIKIMQ